jgi:hypothetical protein
MTMEWEIVNESSSSATIVTTMRRIAGEPLIGTSSSPPPSPSPPHSPPSTPPDTGAAGVRLSALN